ncbi:MAG TPA: hypothetical protein VG488_01035 [Candidatus Angelobacter sp.]|nr:hypothetical protein [Candidatus Angelobacter sp.]
MDMIGGAADGQSRPAIFTGHSAQVSMEAIMHLLGNTRTTISGSKDDLEQTTNVAMGHKDSVVPSRGLLYLFAT